MKKFLIIFWITFLVLSISTHEVMSQPQPQIYVSKDKTLQYAKPKKPTKIKLHRDKKGEYTWDITGENVEDIIKVDKRLRQYFEVQ